MSLQIRKPGLFASIQDLGRFGYQKYGVTIGGVMDEPAARVANLLLGNDEGEAVLELTLTGAELVADSDLWLAICGGDMGPVTDGGEAVPLWRPVFVAAGTAISFGQYRSGCRSYLAIAGGIKGDACMGSRSTYVRGGIGGMQGRALQGGDLVESREGKRSRLDSLLELQTSPSGRLRWPRWHARGFAVADRKIHTVLALRGEHYEGLTSQGQAALYGQIFSVASSSDRMGYRLLPEQGAALERKPGGGELVTEPVAHGTIQLPPDGQPIVLLAERQTTGGYPRVGAVASVDLPVFAQLKPGDAVRFHPVSLEEAQRLALESEGDMDQLRAAISLKLKSGK